MFVRKTAFVRRTAFARRAAIGVGVGLTGLLATALPASALDCHNISRNVSGAEQQIATTATPVLDFPIGLDPATGKTVFWNVMPDFKGTWYLLALTEGAPAPVGTNIAIWWGFLPPGSVPGVTGSNGNYTNGTVDDLLGMAACPTARQVVHGIQSGACGGMLPPA